MKEYSNNRSFDLTACPVSPFAEKLYRLLQTVPAGRVTTYGDLAKALGCRSNRAVGQALARNPFAPEVPCHRVVAWNGTLGGFMGHRAGITLAKKKLLLRNEGIRIVGSAIVDFPAIRHRFFTS